MFAWIRLSVGFVQLGFVWLLQGVFSIVCIMRGLFPLKDVVAIFVVFIVPVKLLDVLDVLGTLQVLEVELLKGL